MSSTSNENNASSNENPTNASVSASSASGTAAASGGNNKPTNLGLTGLMKNIEPVLATQQSRTSKELADRSKGMFKTFKDIIKRSKTSAKFTEDTEVTVNMDDGTTTVKPYIPISMRGVNNKFILQCSKLLRTDSHMSAERAGVQSAFDAADKAYETYQQQCANLAGQIAKLELTANKKLLGHQFLDLLYASSLAFAIDTRRSNKFKDRVTADTMCREYQAHAAVYNFVATITTIVGRSHFWKQLRVFENGGTLTEIKELINAYSQITGINYDTDCKKVMEDENYPPLDREIVKDITIKLMDVVPKLTVDIWESHTSTVVEADETAGELDELFDKMAVDKANDELDEDMDTSSPEEKVEDLINKAVDKKFASNAAKQKQQARKNSGDDAQKNTTASTSTSNGRNSRATSRGNSSRRRGGSRTRSPKRSLSPKSDTASAPSTPSNSGKTGKKSRKKRRNQGANAGGSELVVSPHTTFQQSSGGRTPGRGRGGRTPGRGRGGNQGGARGGGSGSKQN